MGIGLAAAVLIDATIVRGVLLPATMKLLGERELVPAEVARVAAPASSTGRRSSPRPTRVDEAQPVPADRLAPTDDPPRPGPAIRRAGAQTIV